MILIRMSLKRKKIYFHGTKKNNEKPTFRLIISRNNGHYHTPNPKDSGMITTFFYPQLRTEYIQHILTNNFGVSKILNKFFIITRSPTTIFSWPNSKWRNATQMGIPKWCCISFIILYLSFKPPPNRNSFTYNPT